MLLTLLIALGCATPSGLDSAPTSTPPDVSEVSADKDGDSAAERYREIEVTVTLDGAPVEGAVVLQGGSTETTLSDADGWAVVTTDAEIVGDQLIVASHPEARNGYTEIPDDDSAVTVELVRFDASDNPDYAFQDPGEPDRRDSTGQCAHCHIDLNQEWYDSAHRTSASRDTVQDLYAGAAAALADEGACEEAGGAWERGRLPGGGDGDRCYVGDGTLQALNGCDGPCEDASDWGACADCHAPGIDGEIGGRDLLDATEFSFDYGVHCDVCHKVEAVDLDQPAGVAGALSLLRPSEESPSVALGEWAPLTFGPHYDVLNPRMGSSHRDHFKEAEFCGGCHQLDQEVLVQGAAIDQTRWPEGELPIQSTWAEWEAGPMNPGAPCASCHMPSRAHAGNGADIGVYADPTFVGISAGWWREPGSVRGHTWTGPRTEGGQMLQLAASLAVEAEVIDGDLEVSVTATNVGPGHAIPTGEPMRAILVLVEASCDGEPLAAIGGAAVPDYGGALEQRSADEDWTLWPGAAAGQRLRVIERTGAWLDYEGFGPFGDGTFDAEAKGLPEELVAGEVEILSVGGDGSVTLSAPLPDGDAIYRVEGSSGLPSDGDPAGTWAGAAGFGFARVLAGPDGERMVPHFMAVDVVSDNRLLPQTGWTSAHRFEPTCEAPEVQASLIYRRWPLDLAEERGWEATDAVMIAAEATP